MANIMHVSVHWNNHPLLLLATAHLAERNTLQEWECLLPMCADHARC